MYAARSIVFSAAVALGLGVAGCDSTPTGPDYTEGLAATFEADGILFTPADPDELVGALRLQLAFPADIDPGAVRGQWRETERSFRSGSITGRVIGDSVSLQLRIGEGSGLRFEGRLREVQFSDGIFNLRGKLIGRVLWPDLGIDYSRSDAPGRAPVIFSRIAGPSPLAAALTPHH